MASNQTTTSKITLDLYAKNVVAVNAKQYDNKTRFVEITCVENGIIFQVDKLTMSAFIRFKKPDDNGVFNEVEVTSDGKLKIELTEQMLAAPGRAIADVFLLRKVFTSEEKPTNTDDIYKVNAPIISIMDFYINITPTALNHSQIESSYEFNALTNALAQIDYNNKKVVELDKTLTRNENIRNNNESTRQNNEQTRINSEKQRINAEDIRNTSEDKRTKSENERIKQENIRNTSEQQRISSEDSRIINENDRKTNENIRKSNESKRQTNETNRISSEDKRLSAETDRQSNETARQKNESARQTNENTRISNETDRANAEAERVKNENTRISNENTRKKQEAKRQADTATAITNANNAAKNANDKANDLQNKLDNHHFVLTNELENSVSSTSTTHAPTANAVKIAYDKAVSVENTINSNKNNWNDKYTRNEIDNKFSTLESNIYWKEAVSTYTDIAKTYPNPQDGWTVNVKDTDYTYRYSGTSWIAISANAIPKATQSVDGLLSKEDKTNYDDTNSKKHTHSNKSVLDGITSALVTTWNTVTNKLDKTGDASNVTNTITTASTRANLSTGEKLSISLGKIAKWFSDLKTVAFSGSYNDLSNKPSSMPANGGNATTVNGHTVNSDVPTNAKFTDTNTWRGIQNNLTSDSTSDSLSAAQGKALKALIDTKTSNTGTLTGIKMNGVSKGTSGVIDLGTVLTSGKQTATSTADGGSNVYTFSDGSTITVKNGTKGSTGATGSPGAAGKNGSNGTSAAWFTGTAVTGTATSATAFTVSGSKAGDMYLNTSTYNVYRASATNNWIYVCNIKGATGAKGADGKNGTNGTNATTTATGTSSTAGLTKLYTGTGTATDGTMTQNAIKSALDGKANSSHTHSYPGGFAGIDPMKWGVQTGSVVCGWADGSGGSIGFRKNCPSSGKVSMVIDGTVYTNEGTNEVLTTGNYTNYAASKSHSHSYNDLTNKPSIPSVGNGVVTITQNGVTKGAFHLNDGGATNIDLSDSLLEYPMYSKIIDGNYATKFRTETKGDTSHGGYISTIRNNTANVANSPQFGSGIAFGLDDTHGYLYLNYSSAEAYLGGGNQDKLNWIKRIAFTDSTVANATKVNNHTVNSDVPSGAKFTDTNTWRPLGTTADKACAGNDSRLSNARPANGGTSTYANYVYATSHQGSWYQNSQWDGTYFQTNYKNGNNVLPMKVGYSGHADSAGSVAWSNVSGRPSSMPASDVYSWAKASSKPSYTKSEVGLGNVDNTADANKSVKYATSSGSATKSTGVVDYGNTNKTIQIGYNGIGISGNDIKFIAGYTTGNGSDVTAKIKDISKDALKSWLDLGSLASSYGSSDKYVFSDWYGSSSGTNYYYIRYTNGIQMIFIETHNDAGTDNRRGGNKTISFPVSFVNNNYFTFGRQNVSSDGIGNTLVSFRNKNTSSISVYLYSTGYNEEPDYLSMFFVGRWK